MNVISLLLNTFYLGIYLIIDRLFLVGDIVFIDGTMLDGSAVVLVARMTLISIIITINCHLNYIVPFYTCFC